MSLAIKGELIFNTQNNQITFNDITGDYNASTNLTGWGGGVNKTKAQVLETHLRFVKPDLVFVDVKLDGTTSPSSNFIPKNALTRVFSLADLDVDDTVFADGVYQTQYVTYIKVDDSSPAATYSIRNYNISGVPTTEITGINSHFTSVLLGFGDTTMIRVKLSSDANIFEDFSIKEIVSGTVIRMEQLSTAFGLVTDGSGLAVTMMAGYRNNINTLNNNEFLACFLPKIAGLKNIGSKGCGEPDCVSYKNDKEIQELLEMHMGQFTIAAQLEYGMISKANANQRTLAKLCKSSKCGCD